MDDMSERESCEILGEFRLYPPVPGTPRTGWVLSWSRMWLPGSYADRTTVVLAAGLVLGAPLDQGLAFLERLSQRVNREELREITAEDVVAAWSPPYQ